MPLRDAMFLVATPEQWAGAALLVTALALVWAGSRRPARRAPRRTPPMPPAHAHGIMRWLTPFGMPSVGGATPAPTLAAVLSTAVRRFLVLPTTGRAPRPARSARTMLRLEPARATGRTPVDTKAVARLAREGTQAGEIARRTGIARDAVQLVLLRDGAPAATRAIAAAERARDVAPHAAAPRDAGRDAMRDAARRAPRTMPAIPARDDARRDPRPAAPRAADGGRGTRFSAVIR